MVPLDGVDMAAGRGNVAGDAWIAGLDGDVEELNGVAAARGE